MKKLTEPNKKARASGFAALRSCLISLAQLPASASKRLDAVAFLFSLLVLTSLFAASPAMAQLAGPTKTGSGSTLTPDPNASVSGNRGTTGNKGYLQRHPFAMGAYQADTQSKSSLGPQQSNPGSAHTWAAYAPVIKMCDEGYGIAYQQVPMMATGTPAAARDSELFNNLMTTYGLPMSDSQFQILQRENNQRLLELAFDPERLMWMTSGTAQTTSGAVSNAMANSGELALMAVFNRIVNGDGNGSLINVANEGSVAGLAYRGNGSDIDVAMAVSMVQTMYKLVFVPMAVLFLLPGAVISQAKAMASKGFGLQGPEQQSPFDGILRSIVAVFLIPGTQVIVSWAIDTGNSLAYSCRDWIDLPTIMMWTEQLAYNPQVNVNAMTAPNPAGSGSQAGSSTSGAASAISAIGSLFGGSIGGFLSQIAGLVNTLGGYGGIGDGLAANQPEAQAVQQQQDWMGQALQSTLNGAMLMAALTLIILGALQVVTICYLLLMGPLSAAFYAWPQVSSTHLFRGVFGKWVDGVIKVSLWRFFWMAILAIMTQRIIYMGGIPGDLKWEAAVFICFLGLMVGVPAQPFNFAPYTAFGSARQLQVQAANTNSATTGQSPGSSGASPAGQGGGQTTNTGGGGQPQPGGAGQPQPGGTPGDNSGTGTPSPTPGGPTGDQHGLQGAGGPPGSGGPAAPAGGGGPSGAPPAAPPPVTGHGPGDSGTPPPGGGAPLGTTAASGTGASTGSGGSGQSPTQPNVTVSPQMSATGPATPLTPGAGASPSKPTSIANPSAPPPAAAAAPTAVAASPSGGEGAGGGGEDGEASGAAKTTGSKAASSGAGAAATPPDASGAIGQIAGAAGSISPPPPAKNDEGK